MSGANPNTGEYGVTINDNGNGSSTVRAFFYYIRTNINGSTINKWVPYDPDYLCVREYFVTSPPSSQSYPSNLTYNGIVNSGVNKNLTATSSLNLTNGFEVKLGGSFTGEVKNEASSVPCTPTQ